MKTEAAERESSSALTAFARILFSAGPDFWLAATFLITWLRPYTFGETTVHKLTFVMLIEFLVVHSTGFFSAIATRDMARPQRIFISAILLLFYCLFAGAFSASYGSPWPLFAFLMLTVSKLLTVLFRPHDDDTQFRAMGFWAFMTALYLFSTFATVMADVPALGVTPEVIARQGFGVGGVWPEQPYRVMAMGAIYFTGLGLATVVMELWPLLEVKSKKR